LDRLIQDYPLDLEFQDYPEHRTDQAILLFLVFHSTPEPPPNLDLQGTQRLLDSQYFLLGLVYQMVLVDQVVLELPGFQEYRMVPAHPRCQEYRLDQDFHLVLEGQLVQQIRQDLVVRELPEVLELRIILVIQLILDFRLFQVHPAIRWRQMDPEVPGVPENLESRRFPRYLALLLRRSRPGFLDFLETPQVQPDQCYPTALRTQCLLVDPEVLGSQEYPHFRSGQ